jgi:hypothetical protein
MTDFPKLTGLWLKLCPVVAFCWNQGKFIALHIWFDEPWSSYKYWWNSAESVVKEPLNYTFCLFQGSFYWHCWSRSLYRIATEKYYTIHNNTGYLARYIILYTNFLGGVGGGHISYMTQISIYSHLFVVFFPINTCISNFLHTTCFWHKAKKNMCVYGHPTNPNFC